MSHAGDSSLSPAPMHLVLVNQFYPPDVAPTGRCLHELARSLVARGHDVTVLCSRHAYAGNAVFPYRQTFDGVDVRRLPAPGAGRRTHGRRIASAACFYAGVVLRLLFARPRPDLVLCLTSPPWIGLAASLAAWVRGFRHAHWVMDIYPDVMVAHGMLRKSGPAHRLLQRLSRMQYSSAAFVLTLGEEMAAQLRPLMPSATGQRKAVPLPAVVVPLWADSGLSGNDQDATAAESRHAAELTLLYSGNMGRAHLFGDFLAAARHLGTDTSAGAVRFVFAGDGARKGEIAQFIAQHRGAPVTLSGYVPQHALRDHLLAADVLLVSLDPRWQGMLIPSKLQAAFAVGRPVLFVGGTDNSIAAWIRESGAGWAVAPGDMHGLLRAIDEARDPDVRRRMGLAARAFNEKRFDCAMNCGKIGDLIEAAVQQLRSAG